MSTVKEVQKNGKTPNVLPAEETVKTTVIEKKAEQEASAKMNVVKFLEQNKPEPHRSAESRIEAMKQFEALSTRFNQLKEKSNELKTFKAGNDKLGAKIVFKNAQGFDFTVQNSTVIERLIQAGTEELNILLSEAENEVLTFEI